MNEIAAAEQHFDSFLLQWHKVGYITSYSITEPRRPPGFGAYSVLRHCDSASVQVIVHTVRLVGVVMPPLENIIQEASLSSAPLTSL